MISTVDLSGNILPFDFRFAIMNTLELGFVIRDKEMATIKKHQCPSCGGNLTVDNDKQIYRCLSCGSTYDYDYFREDKLNEMGETHLSHEEFGAAVDTYRLILKKNPHDFLALRGLMLAAAYLKNMDGLASIVEAKHFSYDAKMVKEVIGSASEDDKEYFTELGKLYSDKKLQIDCNREIKSLKQKRGRIESAIRMTDDSRYEYYFESRGGTQYAPKAVFIILWCFTAFYFTGELGIAIAIGSEDPVAGIAFLAILGGLTLLFGVGINLIQVYPRMKIIKQIDTYIREFKEELGDTEAKINEYEAAGKRLSEDIRQGIDAFVKKDSLIKADSEKEQVPVPVISKIVKHQCPSCGGSLRIDSDKQMYHCTFCGSTYDYEYFREDRIHEAGETYLSRGEFMATADAYGFMLKKDPHDFIALRGLMLAAAHLTNMSELDQENKDFAYDAKKVNQVIEDASEEDKEYFQEFARVYAEKKKLVECNEEIEALWEKKRTINDNITQNNLGIARNYDKGEFRSKADLLIPFIGLWVLTAFLMLITLGFVKGFINAYVAHPDDIAVETGLLIFFGVITLAVLLINYFGYYSRLKYVKKFEKENGDLYIESGKMDEKIRDLENKQAKLLAGLKRSIHDFVRKDRLRMNDK